MPRRPRQPDRAATRPGPRRRGFTVVEVLIVVGVVILLLSILIVALGQATGAAQRANTQVLLSSLTQAVARFEHDIGYHPPVLDAQRGYLPPPDPASAAYASAIQSWFSVTTLADYLIGYGNAQQDGCGQPDDSTKPAPGIRSPGRDGVWGATVTGNGSLGSRNGGSGPAVTGQVFGPYLELDSERLLGATDGTLDPDGNLRVFFPGEPGYTDALPKVVVDYWGRPIRYYRRAHPRGAIGQPYRVGTVPNLPTLSDFIALRPYTIPEEALVSGWLDDQSTIAPDNATTRQLQAGEFALFSSGSDKALNPLVRVDQPEDLNRDNIVEVGP